MARDELIKELRLKLDSAPLETAYLNFLNIVDRDKIPEAKLIEALKELPRNNFLKFYKKFLIEADDYKIDTFIHGTLNLHKSRNIVKSIIKKLNSFKFEIPFDIIIGINKRIKLIRRQISSLMTNQNQITKEIPNKFKTPKHFDLSHHYIYREVLNRLIGNKSHTIANFYQIGTASPLNSIFAKMIKPLAGNIFFTELRIKEQLGYTTFGKQLEVSNVLYFAIIVRGSRKTPDYMDECIEKLIPKMRERLAKAPQKKIDFLKRAIVGYLRRKDTSLVGRSIRLWKELTNNTNDFNRKEILKHVKQINKANLLQFFDRVFRKNMKKLSIQEFSSFVKKLPSKDPVKVNNFKWKFLKDINDLRRSKASVI